MQARNFDFTCNLLSYIINVCGFLSILDFIEFSQDAIRPGFRRCEDQLLSASKNFNLVTAMLAIVLALFVSLQMIPVVRKKLCDSNANPSFFVLLSRQQQLWNNTFYLIGYIVLGLGMLGAFIELFLSQNELNANDQSCESRLHEAQENFGTIGVTVAVAFDFMLMSHVMSWFKIEQIKECLPSKSLLKRFKGSFSSMSFDGMMFSPLNSDPDFGIKRVTGEYEQQYRKI